MIKADLHTHTSCSDGKLSPAKLVDEAQGRGITVLSITDHDTYLGYFEAKNRAEEIGGISVIPGVEITTTYRNRECHLLGYFFEVGNAELKALLAAQKKARVDRAQAMIQALQRENIDIEMEELVDYVDGDLITRPHLAKLLMKKGVVRSHNEAFQRFLGKGGLAHVPLKQIPIEDAIEVLHRAGGIAVLAHPGLTYTDDDLNYLKSKHLDGVEYIHPSHNYDLQRRYRNWAAHNNLIVTGGSDYHGFTNKDEHFLGIVVVDASLIAGMRTRAANVKQNYL